MSGFWCAWMDGRVRAFGRDFGRVCSEVAMHDGNFPAEFRIAWVDDENAEAVGAPSGLLAVCDAHTWAHEP